MEIRWYRGFSRPYDENARFLMPFFAGTVLFETDSRYHAKDVVNDLIVLLYKII